MTRRWVSTGNSVCIRHIGCCVGRVSRQKRGRRVRGRLSNLALANQKAGGIAAAAFLAAHVCSPNCSIPWHGLVLLYCIVLPRLTADACLVHAHAAVLRSSCRRPMQLQMHCASFGRSKHPPERVQRRGPANSGGAALAPCTAADMDASGYRAGYRAGYRVQGCSF
jgi:hypothetical protein